MLPPDAKTDLSRAYCLALAAAPLLDASRLGERSLTSRELVRQLVASVRNGGEVQQATAVLALGCVHPACHALVLLEASVLAEDYLDRQMQRVSACGAVEACRCVRGRAWASAVPWLVLWMAAVVTLAAACAVLPSR